MEKDVDGAVVMKMDNFDWDLMHLFIERWLGRCALVSLL
jgi:hypothetical protein